jgi:hypothetical protein
MIMRKNTVITRNKSAFKVIIDHPVSGELLQRDGQESPKALHVAKPMLDTCEGA